MTNIKDKIKVQQPREVYTTLTLDGSTCAPRDLKQVQNAKYQQKKETKLTNQKSANNTDDLQHLLSILGDHPYMQEVKGQTSMHNCVHVRPTTRLKKLLFHRCHAYQSHRSRPHIQSGRRLCYHHRISQQLDTEDIKCSTYHDGSSLFALGWPLPDIS